MCGRFAQVTPLQQLARQFQAVSKMAALESCYNISPAANVAVVRISPRSRNRVLESLQWGLVPHWTKDPSKGPGLANARAETIEEKPSFKEPFKTQRCLVPVDGFYEWQQGGKAKQPYYFSMNDQKPFALAGLWDFWKPTAKQKGVSIVSFTLITTASNALMEPIYDRMPVILDEENFDLWLSPDYGDTEILKYFLKPYSAEKMRAEAVSAFVNATSNQGPQCIEPGSIETPDKSGEPESTDPEESQMRFEL